LLDLIGDTLLEAAYRNKNGRGEDNGRMKKMK
jgi:hypothetical protein